MATTNYNLPTITGNMTADVVRDMNALAEATDSAIKQAVDGVELSQITQEVSKVDTKLTQHLDDMVKHNQFMDGQKKMQAILGWNKSLNCPTIDYVEVVN